MLDYKINERHDSTHLEAIAYLLVSQMLFYHIISVFNTEIQVLEIDDIEKISDLGDYFSKITDHSIYQPIFSYKIYNFIKLSNIEVLHSTIKQIKEIKPDLLNNDLLGTIFHDLIPLDVRKKIAAYYTNPLAADFLAWLSINTPDSTIVDFACGSGGLLVAAYQRKKNLIQEHREFKISDHERFLNEEIKGYDAMPFAASIASSMLALQDPGYISSEVRIKVHDSTILFPEKELVSVVIMNPPFTRQERISDDYKNLLHERFMDYEDYIHGQMGLYGYFVFLADKFLEPGGKMAFVLPASVLRARSCEGIRRLWYERYHVDKIITGRKKLAFSDSTWKREILIILNKLSGDHESVPPTKIIGIEKLPENRSELEDITGRINQATGNIEHGDLSIKYISPGKLQDTTDWLPITTTVQIETPADAWERFQDESKGLIPFKEAYNLEKALVRGIETRGDLQFQRMLIVRDKGNLLRKDDEWFLDEENGSSIVAKSRHDGKTVEIPKTSLKFAYRTFSNKTRMDAFHDPDYLVYSDFHSLDGNVFFDADHGIAKNRSRDWKKYVNQRQGHLFIMRRFVINAPGTTHLCYHSNEPLVAPATSWVCKVSGIDAKILCLWFNSSLNLAQVLANRLEDVWVDVHKYQLKDFLVPDISKMYEAEKSELEGLFDSIVDVEFPSLIDQYLPGGNIEMKEKIDSTFLKILGIPANKIKEIKKRLYESIKRELGQIDEMDKK
ncbi:MAG: class I SAM-dependent DNA methyltransferase [Candidatus Hodarchaeota archaeon]